MTNEEKIEKKELKVRASLKDNSIFLINDEIDSIIKIYIQNLSDAIESLKMMKKTTTCHIHIDQPIWIGKLYMRRECGKIEIDNRDTFTKCISLDENEVDNLVNRLTSFLETKCKTIKINIFEVCKKMLKKYCDENANEIRDTILNGDDDFLLEVAVANDFMQKNSIVDIKHARQVEANFNEMTIKSV